MFCENCGAELQDPDQKFCPNCGIPLRVKIFKYSDQKKEFKEGKMKKHLFEILNPDYILIFIDTTQKRVWIWYGNNTTTRMKFIAVKLAPAIRDRYGFGFKIAAVDEGNEPLDFKRMIGLEDESAYTEKQTIPTYEGTDEDLELIESFSREKRRLLLEKVKERDINRRSSIQLFDVIELKEFPFMETREVVQRQIIGDILNESTSEKVFLLVDHDTKRIWKYSGPNSSIKLHNYGEILAEILRQQLRLFYRIYSLNMYSTDDPEFLELLEKPISGGRARSIEKKDFSGQILVAKNTYEKLENFWDSYKVKKVNLDSILEKFITHFFEANNFKLASYLIDKLSSQKLKQHLKKIRDEIVNKYKKI